MTDMTILDFLLQQEKEYQQKYETAKQNSLGQHDERVICARYAYRTARDIREAVQKEINNSRV